MKSFIKKMSAGSLKKSLYAYILIGVVIVAFLYGITVIFCNNWEDLIIRKNLYMYHPRITLLDIDGIKEMDLPRSDYWRLMLVVIYRGISVFLYSSVVIYIVASRFYKDKIQEPLRLMTLVTAKIKNHNLSYSCRYESGDEMAHICGLVDDLRLALIDNEKELWEAHNQQKDINGAFAHDLRTPLTVMEGYLEMMEMYVPEGRLSQEKVMENIRLMKSQINRLREFSTTMNSIQSLDELTAKPKMQTIGVLNESMVVLIKGFQHTFPGIDFELEIDDNLMGKELTYDEDIIMEVVENLLSNGSSFARKIIWTHVKLEDDYLKIYVKDDGPGFNQEDLYQASRAYYSSRKGEDSHFGIGLTVAKILCMKHKGNLSLENSIHGGAIVCASFKI